MDIIYECAANYRELLNIKYHFVISLRRNTKDITIDFEENDFRHMSGLQHIDDIHIERDPAKVIEAIIQGKITDEILESSDEYKKIHPEGRSIKSRVDQLRYLQEYLDISDFIRIYEMQQFGSLIRADYFIEAKSSKRKSTVYVFIRKREQNDNYVVVSFFVKTNAYKGTAAYWMLKEKITDGTTTELYRHPNYKPEDKDEKNSEAQNTTCSETLENPNDQNDNNKNATDN
ncbi:PBECR4 domain-containing protein [Butyrivibrio sp. INlla16]|uniref:PBECR4 domain-containing protein n=1 Tax=Butyrivibrio sp. INlla16 TaxID=1520807 RepID=UPI00088A9FD0|nr:PBECR4 domain-containing protein [Butyrivibrio sp. INlla16]SDB04306.1 hypothetical protein SAMN02910263_00168 [Butyrivibrio sp. INlla16]